MINPESTGLPLGREEVDTYRLVATGRDSTGRDLTRLRALGLIGTDPRDPDRPVALDPVTASQNLLADGVDQLQKILDQVARIPTMGALSPIFNPLRTWVDGSELVASRALMNDRIDQVMNKTNTEVCTAQPTPPAHRDPELIEMGRQRVRDSIERGARVLTIYPPSALDHPSSRAYVDGLTESRAEIRVTRVEFPRIILVDRTHLFVDNALEEPDDSVPGSFSGVHITDRLMVAWVRYLYDLYWESATPWAEAQQSPTGTRTTPTQRSILRVLVDEGLTQQRVAPRLKISHRRVETALQALREELGLRTLYQVMAWWGGSDERHLP